MYSIPIVATCQPKSIKVLVWTQIALSCTQTQFTFPFIKKKKRNETWTISINTFLKCHLIYFRVVHRQRTGAGKQLCNMCRCNMLSSCRFLFGSFMLYALYTMIVTECTLRQISFSYLFDNNILWKMDNRCAMSYLQF